MYKKIYSVILTLIFAGLLYLGARKMNLVEAIQIPQAKKIDHTLEKHGDRRNDPYFWLNERNNPEVITYVQAENKYADAILKPYENIQNELYKEMRSRIQEDDSSVPYQIGNYVYWRKTEKGQEYPIQLRKKREPNSLEEVLLNGPEMAKGHKYFSLTSADPSPNEQMIAFSLDTVGRRFYSIHVKNLQNGQEIISPIENTSGNFEWANDNIHLFFTVQDPKTLRVFQVKRLNIQTQKIDLVYEEKDETFSTWLSKSNDQQFILINCAATLSNEYHLIPADQPLTKPQIFWPREAKHEYSLNHGDQGFFVLTNKNALNNRLVLVKKMTDQLADAIELVSHRTDSYITQFEVFKNFVALELKENGLNGVRIYSADFKKHKDIQFQDTAYTVSIGVNREYETDFLRYEYESFRLPPSTYDYYFATNESQHRKTLPVPNYQADQYVSERLMLSSRDGKLIPVSLFYKKDLQKNSTAPMLVYGYGSYGFAMNVWFSSRIVSLVDRGFVYAVAHVRGGSELGRQWFEDGRVLNKKNSFFDFIDATEGLLKLKYADPKKVFAQGGSAGGLLMGGVVNYRPDLWRGIISQVAFVDVLTTMLDDSIPLTTSEYDQWGNPNEKIYYDYIKSYSPYDNVVDAKYPHILATTGFHDSQVQYWEPAKWIAKIRDHQKGKAVQLLKTNMDAGHGGASGRFEALKEDAYEYSFLFFCLDQEK